jgi:hypothetical protein
MGLEEIPVKPSGPDALSDGVREMAFKISYFVKGTHKWERL